VEQGAVKTVFPVLVPGEDLQGVAFAAVGNLHQLFLLFM
jgi:hypothetical protein